MIDEFHAIQPGLVSAVRDTGIINDEESFDVTDVNKIIEHRLKTEASSTGKAYGKQTNNEQSLNKESSMVDLSDIGADVVNIKYSTIEEIDQVNEVLNNNLGTYGFPECGNLRSTKRKDVKQRIVAI